MMQLSLGKRALVELRGGLVSMIFQEPMTALDPVYTIGTQIAETVLHHKGGSRAAARAWAAAGRMARCVRIAHAALAAAG